MYSHTIRYTVQHTIRYTVQHTVRYTVRTVRTVHTAIVALSQIVVGFSVENKCIVLKNIFDSLLNTCIDADSLLIITE